MMRVVPIVGQKRSEEDALIGMLAEIKAEVALRFPAPCPGLRGSYRHVGCSAGKCRTSETPSKKEGEEKRAIREIGTLVARVGIA